MKGSVRSDNIFVRWFIDQDKIKRTFERSEERAFKSTGAYIRTIGANSIKVGKKPSAPGLPPKTRRKFLKKNIYFAYDRKTRSVVIGPVTYPVINRLQEFGGSHAFEKWFNPAAKAVFTLGGQPKRGGPWKFGGRVNLTFPARPFMNPAFEKSIAKLPSFWKNTFY